MQKYYSKNDYFVINKKFIFICTDFFYFFLLNHCKDCLPFNSSFSINFSNHA